MFDFKAILSVSLILFSVIDIVGNIPIVISLKEQGKKIEAAKATFASGVLMLLFLFGGEKVLGLFGVDVKSFAVAGAIVMFIIGLEMILNREIFRNNDESSNATSIFPLAFPLIAGAGTLTTIISLEGAGYMKLDIGVGILLNLVVVFFVLKFSSSIQKRIGKQGAKILEKVFGIILLAIAIKIFTNNSILHELLEALKANIK
ncbi:MAG: MarC family protein [Saprospiraceae bacterium]|nr:MarC family protein [Saprospiraceae bacterium]